MYTPRITQQLQRPRFNARTRLCCVFCSIIIFSLLACGRVCLCLREHGVRGIRGTFSRACARTSGERTRHAATAAAATRPGVQIRLRMYSRRRLPSSA